MTVCVSMACNNPENGIFAGSAPAFDFEAEDHRVAVVGGPVAVEFATGAVVVGGVRCPFTRRQSWVGNYSWEEVDMSLDDAQQLLRRLLEIACFELDEWDDGSPFAGLIAAHEARRSA